MSTKGDVVGGREADELDDEVPAAVWSGLGEPSGSCFGDGVDDGKGSAVKKVEADGRGEMVTSGATEANGLRVKDGVSPGVSSVVGAGENGVVRLIRWRDCRLKMSYWCASS